MNKKNGFASIVVVVIVVILVIGGIVFLMTGETEERGSVGLFGSYGRRSRSGEVSTDPVQFTAHITDLDKVDRIVPPGSQSGNTFAPHSYIKLLPGVGKVEVYAPIDSELDMVGYYSESAADYDPNADPTIYSQYILFFKVNENVFYYFDHLDEVASKIKEVSSTIFSIEDFRTWRSYS